MAQLEVSHVTKSFDGRKVLEDVSIRLGEKELVALLGVSGGGKTTLFNVISGILKPDSGQVFLDGEEITGSPGKVSYMLQEDLLLPYRTSPIFRNLGWKGLRKSTRLSFPGVCAREQRFCGRICFLRKLPFWTSRFPPLIP